MYTSPLNRVLDYVVNRPVLLVAVVCGLWVGLTALTVLALTY